MVIGPATCPCCREPGRTCSRMLECSEENVFGAEVNCDTKVWSLSFSTEMLLHTHCSPQPGEIADGNARWFSSSPSGLVTKVGTGTPREGSSGMGEPHGVSAAGKMTGERAMSWWLSSTAGLPSVGAEPPPLCPVRCSPPYINGPERRAPVF